MIMNNDNNKQKKLQSKVLKMRFFRKLVDNTKQKKCENENSSNGSIKSQEIPEEDIGNGSAPEMGNEKGKDNEGFEMMEKENLDENSEQDLKEKTENLEKATTECDKTQPKRRHSLWKNLYDRITKYLDHPNLIHWMTLTLLAVALWCIISSIAGSDFLPGTQLFSLILLFVLAYIGGTLIQLVKLPSLLGMLLTGLLLRNVGFIHLKGVYMEVTAVLREMALCIILIRAGLGLDPKALKSLRFVILRVACVPGIVEGLITTVVTHFLLGLPWLWGMLLGAILAAVSPAVVIPCLFSLQERGYGTDKGIPTLVVAAASLDDILAITVFGIVLNVIYSANTNLAMQIAQGPLGIIIGIIFGIFWGFIAHFVPHQKDNQVVLLRVLMIIGGGLMAIVGSEAIGYQGAGPLGCIIAAFVACLGWRKQDYCDEHNPVADVFRVIWQVFQPILFGLIGSEVDVSVLELATIGNGLIAVFCSLVGRIVVTIFIAFGAGFNWKEKTFIAWAWFPKATVQAALGPLALDIARKNGSEEEIAYASKILVLAVLAILITAPIGSALITILGPKLLTKVTKKPTEEQAQESESNLKSTEEDESSKPMDTLT